MAKIDFGNFEKEMAKAMKELDAVKLNKDLQESMSKVEWEKLQKELEKSMKEFDGAKLQKELQESMSKIEWDKMKTELDKIKDIDMKDLQLDMDKLKIEMENLGPKLENAKLGMEKAKVEMKEYKAFVDGLEKDGLINKKEDYTIKHKDGELFINGKKTSDATYNKYKSFLEKRKSFTIEKSADDFNLDID
jgi:hypothetical protein